MLIENFDYFEQTNGPSTWAIEEVSKAIENNLVPYEYQAAFTFNNFVLQGKMMQGTGNNMFSPKSKLTREQTYIIMYSILNDTEFYSLYSKASEAIIQ